MSQVHSVTDVPVHSLPLGALFVRFALEGTGAGVAGRNGPAEEGGGGRQTGRRQGGTPPPGKARCNLADYWSSIRLKSIISEGYI